MYLLTCSYARHICLTSLQLPVILICLFYGLKYICVKTGQLIGHWSALDFSFCLSLSFYKNSTVRTLATSRGRVHRSPISDVINSVLCVGWASKFNIFCVLYATDKWGRRSLVMALFHVEWLSDGWCPEWGLARVVRIFLENISSSLLILEGRPFRIVLLRLFWKACHIICVCMGCVGWGWELRSILMVMVECGCSMIRT